MIVENEKLCTAVVCSSSDRYHYLSNPRVRNADVQCLRTMYYMEQSSQNMAYKKMMKHKHTCSKKLITSDYFSKQILCNTCPVPRRGGRDSKKTHLHT